MQEPCVGHQVVHMCPHAAPLIQGFYRQKVKNDSRAQKATDRGTKLHPTLPWPSGLLSGGQGFPRALAGGREITILYNVPQKTKCNKYTEKRHIQFRVRNCNYACYFAQSRVFSIILVSF